MNPNVRQMESNAGFRASKTAYPKVLGLVCMDNTFTHHDGVGWLQDRFSLFCLSDRNDRHRARIAQAFQAGWMGGSVNTIDLNGRPRTGLFSGPPVDGIMPLRGDAIT